MKEEKVGIENGKVKMLNIGLLGLLFCFIFTGFNTMGQTQALIYKGAQKYKEGFQVDGLIANGIVYGVFAFASWFAPSIVLAIGPRGAMLLAGITYLFNIVQLLYLEPISIYIAAAILGFGAPIIWTAQGNFLANNSDPTTITRNSGVFWAMNMSSAIIGNLLAFFLFRGVTDIPEDKKNILAIILTSVSAVGVLLIFGLRPTPWAAQPKVSMVETLKDSGKLFVTRDMLILSITLFYTGLHQSMWAGVYSTCIGYTNQFPDAKSLAAISGIIVAVGEVTGAILFGFLGYLTVKRGRHPIIILGFILSMIAYFLMFINIPPTATIDPTDADAIIGKPNVWIALTTSFLLGFSDACFITQVTAILGGVFADRSASAFGIFKFVQSLASCGAFFCSVSVELQWQLLVVVIFDIFGTAACVKVELNSRKTKSVSLELKS